MTPFKYTLLSLLTLVAFVTSCYGQLQSGLTDVAKSKTLSFTSRNTKLQKTQGTTEHQNIHCSLQAKDGSIWFGTTGEGVYRYDGTMFTQFTEKDGLSNNTVWSILEDSSANIWFGTDDGVCRYNGKNISKITLAINSSLIGITTEPSAPAKNAVWSMMQDKTGLIWLGTSQDLYCYDGTFFSRFLDKPQVSNMQQLKLKYIQCLLQDSSGTIWMGSGPATDEGVVRYDGKSLRSEKPNGDGWIRYITEDKKKHIWFSGRHRGVFVYDGLRFSMFKEKANLGSAIFADKKGNTWFDGSEKLNSIEHIDGVWRYDGNSFEQFNVKDGIGKNSVWSMLEDRQGNIWLGTRNCGLYRYDGKRWTSFSE